MTEQFSSGGIAGVLTAWQLYAAAICAVSGRTAAGGVAGVCRLVAGTFGAVWLIEGASA